MSDTEKPKKKRYVLWIVAGTIVLSWLITAVPGLAGSDPKPDKPAPVATPAPAPEPTEVVFNSPWDGSVYQVKGWLKDNSNDPKSLEYIEWSPVIKTDTGFLVRCKYRGRNGFGALILAEQLFLMDKDGNVTAVQEYEK